MRLFCLLMCLLLAFGSLTSAQQRPAIQLFTPTGWMLEVRPDGSGTLIWQNEPYPHATARPHTFDYSLLLEELIARPEGNSGYTYAFVPAQAYQKTRAPTQCEPLHRALKKAARILYSHTTGDFYQTRMLHPVYARNTEKTISERDQE